jgi:large subunit ribosomal protein L15
MDLGSLNIAPNSRHSRKRVGRGEGSGYGVTAGRGNKGQHSRSGSKRRAWFEGGQMPLQRRLPKFGFTNYRKKRYQILNVEDLNKLEKVDKITPEVLEKKGMIKNVKLPVKILGVGSFDKKIQIEVHAISKSARELIEKSGGKVTLL